jgi:hypothetical protein
MISIIFRKKTQIVQVIRINKEFNIKFHFLGYNQCLRQFLG